MTGKTAILLAGLILCSAAFAEEPLAVKGTFTYGPLGPPHSERFVIGDGAFTKHTISGLRHDAEGNFDFSFKTSLYSKDGKAVEDGKWFHIERQMPTPTLLFPTLKQTANRAPGDYIVRCFVKDNVSSREVEFDMPFELVEPQGLSILMMRCSNAKQGFLCGSTIVVGDAAHVSGTLTNLKSDEGRMRCEVNVAILDLHGKPVDWGSTSKNIDREVSRYGNDNSEEFAHSFIGVKSGKYVIRVKATDHIGGKQANEYLPLHVLEAPDWTLPEEVRAAERKPAPAMKR